MAVTHARQKAQLNGICDVPAISERSTPSRVCDELEASLAVTVFEILPTESMAMHAKQQAALGTRDDRDLFGDIAPAQEGKTRRVRARRSFFLVTSGRHMTMSRVIARRPPRQLPRPSDEPVRAAEHAWAR
jgi:hypothetical protein